MSTVLLGEGQARYNGKIISGLEAMKIAGLEPITLAPKEGLALLNGTQASTAFALEGLFVAEDLFASATVCGAMSVEAALGSRRPFDPRIHRVRGHRTQMDAATAYRHLLDVSSEIGQSHSNCEKVQDPYSLRCQPQVMALACSKFEVQLRCWKSKPTLFLITHSCLPRMATSSQAATSMLNLSPWLRIIWRWRLLKSAASPSAAWHC